MTGRLLPSLPAGALRAFEAASRLGSLKAAAAELSVTPAAISHQIKALEARLGAPLFERLHRSLRLTSAGERLAAPLQAAHAELEDVLATLSVDGLIAAKTTLAISSAPTFAARWLAPRLYRFQAAHPAIDIKLTDENALMALSAEQGVDVAIRYGVGPYDASLWAEALWEQGQIIPVCSPAIAAKLAAPVDLLKQPLLRTAAPGPGSGANLAGWPAWLALAGVVDATARATVGPHFRNSQLALVAAASGAGVALAPDRLVRDDLAAGRLVRPFRAALPDPHRYWMLYRRDRAQEARLRAFAYWLRREAKAD